MIIYNKLLNKGFSKRFSEHFANLFVREPMIVFEKMVKIVNELDPTHFLSLLSTNWNSLRIKPPLIKDGDKFFKIEVRPCDLQFTPFENAAIITFIILYSRLVLNYDINHIIPIEMLDRNFDTAHLIDAITKEKFYWRINGVDKNYKECDHKKNDFLNVNHDLPQGYEDPEKDKENIKLLSLHEILSGNENYIGLIPLMKEFVVEKYPKSSHPRLLQHLNFLQERAKGKLQTDAKYIREFVINHPKYNRDSIVSQEIAYELSKRIINIQNYKEIPIELFEDCQIESFEIKN